MRMGLGQENLRIGKSPECRQCSTCQSLHGVWVQMFLHLSLIKKSWRFWKFHFGIHTHQLGQIFIIESQFLSGTHFFQSFKLTLAGPVCSALHQNWIKFWLALPIDAWGLVFVKLESYQPQVDLLRLPGILGKSIIDFPHCPILPEQSNLVDPHCPPL